MKNLVSTGRARRSAGNAIIEFALIFPLIFTIFTGVFQFGYALYVYNELQTAVRSGARYASALAYESSAGSPAPAYLQAVRNTVVYGSPTASGSPVVPGLTTSHVSVSVSSSNNVPDKVSVAITNYSLNALFKSYALSGKPAATFEYVGRLAN
jgi:Flp pilus assembly protein TadG